MDRKQNDKIRESIRKALIDAEIVKIEDDKMILQEDDKYEIQVTIQIKWQCVIQLTHD